MLSTKVDFWRGLSTILQLLFAIKEGKKRKRVVILQKFIQKRIISHGLSVNFSVISWKKGVVSVQAVEFPLFAVLFFPVSNNIKNNYSDLVLNKST